MHFIFEESLVTLENFEIIQGKLNFDHVIIVPRCDSIPASLETSKLAGCTHQLCLDDHRKSWLQSPAEPNHVTLTTSKLLLNDGACHKNEDALRVPLTPRMIRNHEIMIYEFEKLCINREKALQSKEDIELEFMDLCTTLYAPL